MIIFLGAMNGAVFSNNLLGLFFFWEVTTLCCFLLIGHERTREANESALRALIFTLGGGVAFALAILLFWVQMDTLSLSEFLESGGIFSWSILPVALMALARVEAPRGELFYYAKGNNTKNLDRVKIQTPSFVNIHALRYMIIGEEFANVPVIIASIDPCLSCTDR